MRTRRAVRVSTEADRIVNRRERYLGLENSRAVRLTTWIIEVTTPPEHPRDKRHLSSASGRTLAAAVDHLFDTHRRGCQARLSKARRDARALRAMGIA
jgi:hypothetical protein